MSWYYWTCHVHRLTQTKTKKDCIILNTTEKCFMGSIDSYVQSLSEKNRVLRDRKKEISIYKNIFESIFNPIKDLPLFTFSGPFSYASGIQSIWQAGQMCQVNASCWVIRVNLRSGRIFVQRNSRWKQKIIYRWKFLSYFRSSLLQTFIVDGDELARIFDEQR